MLGTEFPHSNDPKARLHKTNQDTITRYPSADTQKEIYRDDEARTITLHAKRTKHTTLHNHSRLCTRRSPCSLRVRVGVEFDFFRLGEFEHLFETFSTINSIS
jgi:hypothetical protein